MCYGNVNMNTGGYGGIRGGYSTNPSVSFGSNQCDPFGLNQSLGSNQPAPDELNKPNPFGSNLSDLLLDNQSSSNFNPVSSTKPDNNTIGQMQQAKELCGENGVKSFNKKSNGGVSVGLGGKGTNIGISGDGESGIEVKCNSPR